MLVSIDADLSVTLVVENSHMRALFRSCASALPALNPSMSGNSVAVADDRRAKEYRIAS
jgi:hypothetical protein